MATDLKLTIRGTRGTALATCGILLALQACTGTSAEFQDEPRPRPNVEEEVEPTSKVRDASVETTSETGPAGPTVPAGELDGVPLSPPMSPPTDPPKSPVDVPPAAPDPRVAITGVRANGTGCPVGFWTSTPTQDHGVELRIDGFAATLEGANPPSATRDCQLALQIEAREAGLSYTVESVTYEGHATLGASARAELSVRTYFQGDATQRSESARSFSGPMDADYQFVDQVDAARAVWSPCGQSRDLNLSTTLRLSNGGDVARSTLSLGRITGLRLAVRECGGEVGPGSAADDERGAAEEPGAPTGDGPSITSVTRR